MDGGNWNILAYRRLLGFGTRNSKSGLVTLGYNNEVAQQAKLHAKLTCVWQWTQGEELLFVWVDETKNCGFSLTMPYGLYSTFMFECMDSSLETRLHLCKRIK